MNCKAKEMKLTTRAHYSVKALLDLSLQPTAKPTSVAAIAKRQDIPAPYLEKLLIELRRAGLVISVRGANGGYYLAQRPAQISLGQILQAVGETVHPLLERTPQASQAEDWVIHSLWQRLNAHLQTAIFEITLADLYYDARSWQATQEAQGQFMI